ncbi:MAG: hypothetical protein M3Y09_01470 [Actinomycetota bacterium]|nr:hypothetical protein [Actinomycetota bacterium]
MPVFALASGSLILVAFLIVLFFAVVFGYYTYRGSGINAHPHDGSDSAPGAADPSDPGGQSRTAEGHDDEFDAGGGFSTHGTK